jgi:hypothetical protein
MVLSLVMAASPWEAFLDRPAPTNAERAKRGLLPRKGRPSRVTYLDEAARRRGEVRPLPALATAPVAVAADPEVREERAPRQPVLVAAAEPAAEARSSVAMAAPPPSRAAAEAEEVAADRARDERIGAEPVIVERAVDSAGRILEKRLGPDLAVLSVRVVGAIDELPVLSSDRAENGEIVERVRDRAGLLEVRRDPVGRFLAVRALPPPGEDEGD